MLALARAVSGLFAGGLMTFAEALERSRAAYARGLAGNPEYSATPDDASENLGLRDRMPTAEKRPRWSGGEVRSARNRRRYLDRGKR